MKVNDYIPYFLVKNCIKRVYGLMGGGASGLNDGFIKNPDIHYVSFHHEQSAAHAAIGESKVTGLPTVVNPTTGCGGTNCITSVLNAWQDGIPVIFISGNVKLNQTSRFMNHNNRYNIRKYGIQEHDIIETVKSITKMAITVQNADNIPRIMNEAYIVATTGRPGPVWIDIPSDIQQAEIPEFNSEIIKYILPEIEKNKSPFTPSLTEYESYELMTHCTSLFVSERPLVLVGQGIKQAREEKRFNEFIFRKNIPTVYTYGATDILPFNDPLVIGSIGIKGSRAGNFAMSLSDHLLVLGSSLNISHTGYVPENFTLGKMVTHIDIDNNELEKCNNIFKNGYKPFNMTLKSFFDIMENTYE